MVLWDGSPHPWFGSEYPPCCLMAAMDDARGKLLAACFFSFEGAFGYLWLLKTIVKQYGIPAIIYQDRHGALHRNDSHWTLEEQLAGRQEPTQVGGALEALGIRPIAALSPQAKGRIEKLFSTLQDRLGAELRFKGIQTIEEANTFLKSFIRAFNRRFTVPLGTPTRPGERSRRIWTWIASSVFAIRLWSVMTTPFELEDGCSIFPQAQRDDPMLKPKSKFDNSLMDRGASITGIN